MKKLLFIIVIFLLTLTSCDNKKEVGTERQGIINACDQITNTLNKKEDTNTADTNLDDYYVTVENYDSLLATKCFVYYLKLLYSNEAFPISNKPVKFVGNYVKNNEVIQYNEVSLLSKIEKENNKITCEAYGDSHMGNEKSFFYMYLDIDYDFNSDNVTSYNMYMAPVENDSIGSPSDISAEKYKENVLYKFRTNSTEAQAELARTINDLFFEPFKEVVKTSITIDTDFSNEYTKATNDIFGDNFF